MRETPFNWRCPFCERDVTIVDANHDVSVKKFELNRSSLPGRYVVVEMVTCPNPDCKKYSLQVAERAITADQHGNERVGGRLNSWTVVPFGSAKVFPDYVPEQIRGDYTEACLIRDLSPRAAATLARRCLQGMVRDFWTVTGKDNLWQEIQAIKDRVDPLTWSAIDSVRSVGNIGAHMEADVNLVIAVEPDEASQLIVLVEVLLQEWYVVRHEREAQMHAVIALAEAKKLAKEPPE